MTKADTGVWELTSHGAVAAVTYYSTALQKFRRMHVYTPPGYDLGGGRFPVFSRRTIASSPIVRTVRLRASRWAAARR